MFCCGAIKWGVYSVTPAVYQEELSLVCKWRSISVNFVFIGVIQSVQLNVEPTHTVYKPVHICVAARLFTTPSSLLHRSDSQISSLCGNSRRRADDIICCTNIDDVPAVPYSLPHLKHFLRHIYRRHNQADVTNLHNILPSYWRYKKPIHSIRKGLDSVDS